MLKKYIIGIIIEWGFALKVGIFSGCSMPVTFHKELKAHAKRRDH